MPITTKRAASAPPKSHKRKQEGVSSDTDEEEKEEEAQASSSVPKRFTNFRGKSLSIMSVVSLFSHPLFSSAQACLGMRRRINGDVSCRLEVSIII